VTCIYLQLRTVQFVCKKSDKLGLGLVLNLVVGYFHSMRCIVVSPPSEHS